jgi:hypothetical protein
VERATARRYLGVMKQMLFGIALVIAYFTLPGCAGV